MSEHEIKLVAMVSKLYVGMITKLYMIVSTMSNDWWYDFDETFHVWKNKNHFKYYEVIEDRQKVAVRNHIKIPSCTEHIVLEYLGLW